MKKLFLILIVVFLITSCTTIDSKFGDVRMGMSYDEIIDMCGQPSGMMTTDSGNIRIEYYGYQTSSRNTRDYGDFFIEFTDGVVIGYGVINQRMNTAGGGGAIIMTNTTV